MTQKLLGPYQKFYHHEIATFSLINISYVYYNFILARSKTRAIPSVLIKKGFSISIL